MLVRSQTLEMLTQQLLNARVCCYLWVNYCYFEQNGCALNARRMS
jgi:hypothetical protein